MTYNFIGCYTLRLYYSRAKETLLRLESRWRHKHNAPGRAWNAQGKRSLIANRRSPGVGRSSPVRMQHDDYDSDRCHHLAEWFVRFRCLEFRKVLCESVMRNLLNPDYIDVARKKNIVYMYIYTYFRDKCIEKFNLI